MFASEIVIEESFLQNKKKIKPYNEAQEYYHRNILKEKM